MIAAARAIGAQPPGERIVPVSCRLEGSALPARCRESAGGKTGVLILAMDTALERCQAGVFDMPGGTPRALESRPMKRGHAESLMPMIARLAARGDVALEEVDRIAVTTGPGSFTGLRVGVAAARGLALALDRPAVGVTTLAALAESVRDECPGRAIAAAIDARHGNVYFAMYDTAGNCLVEPVALAAARAARHAARHAALIVGTGAVLLARSRGDAAALDSVGLDAPRLAAVARLAVQPAASGDRPVPLYLRPADARPQRKFRIARKCS